MDQLLLNSESMAHQILPFIQRNLKDLTAHGIGHSVAVIKNLNQLIDIMIGGGFELSQTEIRLLYCAAWLHDIGNLTCKDKKVHALESCKLLERLETKYAFLGDLQTPLEFIVKYHSSKYDLSEVPEKPMHYQGEQIRLQLLCPLFRLADACHIGEDRAYRLVYFLLEGQLETESQDHWKANSSVLSVEFDIKGRRIVIYVSNAQLTKLLTDKLIQDFESVRPYLSNYFPFERVEISEEQHIELEH